MHRMRVLFGSLLPALWLLATGHYCFDLRGDCGADGCVTSIVAAHQNPRLPAKANGCLSQQSLRSWIRRPWFHIGPDGLSPFLFATVSVIPGSCEADAKLSLLELAPGLTSSWQFLCRTALEPRAPSRIS
jgi:hypothetical protein